MKTNKNSILWSVLTKYDGSKDFGNFCDSISNIIQDKSKAGDLVTIYQRFNDLDKEDYMKVNEVIGDEISNHLFTF